MTHPHQFTLNLLRSLIEATPIAFSKQRKNEMMATYDGLQKNLTTDVREIEERIIEFGKEIWPYREAYQELYELYGRAEEEEDLKKMLPEELRPKYEKFIAEKGNIEQVRGKALDLELYFTPDERVEIVNAELSAHDKAHKELERSIAGENQEEYFASLEKFRKRQEEINEKLKELRALAEKSEKWKSEILEKVRTFEEGFGYLERPITLLDIKGEIEYYLGVLGVGEEQG